MPISKNKLEKMRADEDRSNLYRGRFITAFARFEKMLDFMLALHYAKNKKKQYEMIQIILDRMTFESKRTALKALYELKSSQDGFVKTKNNSYPHSKLFDEVRRLNDHRNYFAHYMAAMSDEGETLVLYNIRDKVYTHVYTDIEIDKLIEDIEKLSEQILDKNNLPK